MIENRPPCPLADLGHKRVRRLARHVSQFQELGSDKPGVGQSAGFKLHPNLSRLHCKRARWVTAVFESNAVKRRRSNGCARLSSAVVLMPEDGDLAIDLRGELASMVSQCAGAETQKAPTGEPLEVLQIRLVAGTGFEPVTFRL